MPEFKNLKLKKETLMVFWLAVFLFMVILGLLVWQSVKNSEDGSRAGLIQKKTELSEQEKQKLLIKSLTAEEKENLEYDEKTEKSLSASESKSAKKNQQADLEKNIKDLTAR